MAMRGEEHSSVSSSALIVSAGLSRPSKFSQLSLDTNLNNPPDNWLCGRFGNHNWSYPLKRNNSSMVSSFRMANNFPDCVGSVDVIADADSIKKLLFMPFDSSHVSLMVHRVGNSLLIDEFDLAYHLLRSEGKQWSWLKKFFAEIIVQDNNSFKVNSRLTKRPITRYDLQSQNMLCKFLHHSIDQNNDVYENDQNSNNIIITGKNESNTDKSAIDLDYYKDGCPIPEMVEQQLETIENKLGSNFGGHLRNVLWNFEDIRMLVSSNMPIFGDADHPAVSLRLLDMKRPINVLTGLDYWLDNLMCSVPEVVMCYHLDGIVQKYELINTEDIPHMSNNKKSQFSPKVIRNIAQNILTFLKSKATKSGHTYWLFKGKNDDVVKLYDLTTLCSDYMDEDDVNPYTIPVAMLLYRVAKNMMDSNKSHSPVIKNKIHKLLTNCLSLLDSKKHSKIVSSANYLLSDVYVPNDIDPMQFPVNVEHEDTEDEEEFDDFDDENLSFASDSNFDCNVISTLDVTKLSNPNYYSQHNNYEKVVKQKHTNQVIEQSVDWFLKCDNALKHVIEGLKTLIESKGQNQDEMFGLNNETASEKPKMANPFEAIPLHYESIQSNCNKSNQTSQSKISPKKKMKQLDIWQTCMTACLLRKGIHIYCILAELYNTKKNFVKALKYVRMGILFYECAQIVIENNGQINYLKEPIACLLALCGDIHISILSNSSAETSCDTDDDSIDSVLIELLEKVCGSDLKDDYRWAYNPMINSENIVEDRLKLCYRCYEEAEFQLKDSKHSDHEFKTQNSLSNRLVKRFGNISNELATYYMNQAFKYFNESQSLTESETNKLNVLLQKCVSHFETAANMFKQVNDKVNVALIYSNTGRLMRTYAHILAPRDKNSTSNEFSPKEKHYYLKAVDYYKLAFKELDVDGEKLYTSVWDTINWELSTTWFTMGCLMQDYAPLSSSAFELVEKDVAKYMIEALTLCQNAEKWDSPRLVLYQYRAANINHRLASLYHNSYRNMTDESGKGRKLFKMSNDHYNDSRLMFKQLNHKIDFLRVTLEQIGLHENNLISLTGFASKIKALNGIMNLMLSISDVNFSDDTDMTAEEKSEVESLLELFETRMILCVKSFIKCLSNKASKYKDAINRWRDVDQYISPKVESRKLSVYDRIKCLCDKLQSSSLLDAIENTT